MEDNSDIYMAADNSESTASTSESMEDILQLSNRSCSAGDTGRFKMFCRPSYRIRQLTSKGALLVLVWNCLVTSVFYYLSLYPHAFHPSWHMYSIAWGLTQPIAGWLADVYLGRYTVIRWSILIMWTTSTLVVASSVLSQLVESYYSIDYYIHVILLIIISFAFGGYQANIVLFGLDQLQDASTDEITSFISWYLFTFFSGGIVIYSIDLCLGKAYNGILDELTICVCLALMVILAFWGNKYFLKEPITQNPFRLIYKVIKYAIKTKHPRCRSAFTYCEDELPSRIDFGKRKYGGPFTTEEVENVKTFLRLLLVIFVTSALTSGMFSSGTLGNKIILTSDEDLTNSNFKGFREITINNTISLANYVSGAVLVLLHEFVFYPFLQKPLPCIRSYYWKLFVGAVSQIANIIALMAIDLTAHHNYIKHNNSTLQCIFAEESGILSSDFNIKWMILSHVLNSVSIVTFAIAVFEFICSQTPYSMRGLLFGAMYGSLVLCSVAGYGLLQPFTKQSTRVWSTRMIGCEFWYLLLILLIVLVETIMLCILMKWYKNRKREDVLPNEQIFAERYYTKY